MRITHNAEKVKEFSNIMLEKFYKNTKKRKGWHRGDAIGCPIASYWRLTGEIESVYTSKDAGTLLLGTLAHIALHANFETQEKVFWLANKVAITVDAVQDEYPIETKTTRRKIYKKEDIPESWLEQLAIAMAVMDADKGYLMVMNIITYGLTVWEITMTKEERALFSEMCIWQILLIDDAVKRKDPSILTPKYKDCEYCCYKPRRGKKGCRFYRPKKT